MAYFSTQSKCALPGKKKSNLMVLLMHVECWGLADYMKNTQTVIFWRKKKDGNVKSKTCSKLNYPPESLSRTIPYLQKWPNKGTVLTGYGTQTTPT